MRHPQTRTVAAAVLLALLALPLLFPPDAAIWQRLGITPHAQGGPIRRLINWWREHRHRPEPRPEPQPEPRPEPQPEPRPEPQPGTTIIVGVWDTLAMPISFTAAAHSHDLAIWLAARNADWRQIDPIVASQSPPAPPWVQSIFAAAARDKLAPPYLYVCPNSGPALPHQITPAETLTGLQALLTEHLPTPKILRDARLPRRPTGLLKRPPDKKELKAAGQVVPKLSAALTPLKPADYPQCDLRSAIRIIDDQSNTSLCTSFAGVTLTEHCRYLQFGPANAIKLSAANVATRINGWDGATLSDVIEALAADGVCSEHDHPELTKSLPKNWEAKARPYRWLKFYDSPDADPLGYTCAALARGWVAIIGIDVGGNFDPDSSGYISYARGSGQGGHAVVACGYDRQKTPGRILIANSWGKDWGQFGFAWIENTFLIRTQYDGPYVCTAVAVASEDTGPTIGIPQSRPGPAVPAPARPGDADYCPTCPHHRRPQ
jgi:hypothetical protein